MSAARYHRGRRRGGAPSWYVGGWTQEGKARNKSLAGYQEWEGGGGGGKDGMAKETGDGCLNVVHFLAAADKGKIKMESSLCIAGVPLFADEARLRRATSCPGSDLNVFLQSTRGVGLAQR